MFRALLMLSLSGLLAGPVASAQSPDIAAARRARCS